jgi:hypothetical protein
LGHGIGQENLISENIPRLGRVHLQVGIHVHRHELPGSLQRDSAAGFPVRDQDQATHEGGSSVVGAGWPGGYGLAREGTLEEKFLREPISEEAIHGHDCGDGAGGAAAHAGSKRKALLKFELHPTVQLNLVQDR